jgi:hypothetical protein
VETPEHEEFCKQFRENRITLALERHNIQYLKNQRRSPVETRLSNSYYVYSEPATPDAVPGKQMEAAKPDELPGKRKKVKLSGRFPGTSVKQTGLPPSGGSRTSQIRHKRKKNRYDLLYERSFEDTLRGNRLHRLLRSPWTQRGRTTRLGCVARQGNLPLSPFQWLFRSHKKMMIHPPPQSRGEGQPVLKLRTRPRV